MFFNIQNENEKQEYQKFLETAGSLSNLFSDSKAPYLYYRVAEKVFCRAFDADDLSRSDVSVDARKGTLGIGLKTFLLGNQKSFQKVAEFNKDRDLYKGLDSEELVKKVSELRNARIDFAQNTHGLEKSIYHCIVRDSGKFKIFEEGMDKVDIGNIKNIKTNRSSIAFHDGLHEYSFLLSKSTLTKRFLTDNFLYEFDVNVLQDPLSDLYEILSMQERNFGVSKKIKQTIYLPLYSIRDKKVQDKSALNSWNASQKKRKRDPNEVYIIIPAEVHKYVPGFFPNRETPFSLILPNGKDMKSKICSDKDKALYSFSNKELGKWILRDVLKLNEGELLTYERLQILGIDSVRIDKIEEDKYEINFASIGSYEKFIEKYKK